MNNKQSIENEYLHTHFINEVTNHGGHIINTASKKHNLLVEAIFPVTDVLQKGDYIQGGVALYISPTMISVNNYLFRLICENGMVVADDLNTHIIWQEHDIDINKESIVALIKDRVESSAQDERFFDDVNVLRSTLEKEVILLKEVLSLPRFSEDNHMLDELLTHAILEDEDTAFGLVNTITATARDENDPEIRYTLQKTAGEIARKIYLGQDYLGQDHKDFSDDEDEQPLQKMIA